MKDDDFKNGAQALAASLGLATVRGECDGILTLAPPDPYFTSFGADSDDFAQVESADALRVLEESNQRFF